ncbi:MAG: hypothetical protein C0603_11150 [Denitrovibrio sp.]|nr:MAG: hypothetical protein C0603_11150 [Denitrovibrio sp.]
MITACGGGGGSSTTTTPTTLGTDTTSDLTAAYTALETSERTAFTTILTNSDDADSQEVMSSMSAGSAGGLDSSDMLTAYNDADARAVSNPFTAGTASYSLYEAIAEALFALKSSNTSVYDAYATLFATLDDAELAAIVDVIDAAEAMGFDTFDTLADSELSAIVSAAHAASDAATPVSGVVVDPYIEGAVFCVDVNENDDCDADEPVSSASDANGAFTFDDEPADGSIILMKVAGEHNGVPYAFDGLAGVYSGGDIVVSPLTTFQAEGLTAAQVAEMFTFAGLTGITAENIVTNYMDGLIDGVTVNSENLIVLRSSIAAYMLFRILEGSTTLASMTANEIYTSAMTNGGAVNSILVAMTSLLNDSLSEARLTQVQTGSAGLVAMGFPEIAFADVVTTAVAVADRISTIGFSTCNATSGTDAQKVTAAVGAATTFVATHGLEQMIEDLSTSFYFARIKNQLSAAFQTGAANADPAYAAALNCVSGTFTLESDGSVACYVAQ